MAENEALGRIDLFSHGLEISKMHPLLKGVVWEFLKDFREFKEEFDYVSRRKIRKFSHGYFFVPEDRRHTCMHRLMFEPLMEHLRNHRYDESKLEIHYHEPYLGLPCDISVIGKEARDYQVPIVEHIFNTVPTACLPVQTGRGKTLMALLAAQLVDRRIGMIAKSAYCEKWKGDISGDTNIELSEIEVLTGSPSVIKAALRELGRKGKTRQTKIKTYIIALETLNSFINRFILKGEECPFEPRKLLEILGIGFLIKDEVHENFHQLYKVECYLDVPRVVSLSATIKDTSKLARRMHGIIWPMSIRYNQLEYIKYTDVYTVPYYMQGLKGYDYKSRGSYSHNQFESSILRNPKVRDEYLRMIDVCIETYFHRIKKENQRCIVYASMNNTVDLIQDHIQNKYPEYQVNRYIQKDPLSNITSGDITITSPSKAGAAIDIPGLRTVIDTVNCSSERMIEQKAGRLRELKDCTPNYIYTWTPNIQQHCNYKETMLATLSDKTKSQTGSHLSFHMQF